MWFNIKLKKPKEGGSTEELDATSLLIGAAIGVAGTLALGGLVRIARIEKVLMLQ